MAKACSARRSRITRARQARPLRVAAFWLALWLMPRWTCSLIAGTGNVFTSIAVFFSKMAFVTFGGAYAVLAYVAQQAVTTFHWVTPGEMLDGLGMAETTPGPLIMVLQFVGFMAAFRAPGNFPPLLAGALGGLLATWVTFTPCFLWIFVGAPYIEQLRGNKTLTGALLGDNGGCRRRRAQPGDLVRRSHDISCHAAHRRTRDKLRRAHSGKPRRLEPDPRGRRGDCDLPLQDRDDSTLAASCGAGAALHALGFVTAPPL